MLGVADAWFFLRHSVPETHSYGTGCIFRAPYRKGPIPFWRLLYSVRAMLSFFWQFEKFGTGEGLLWYGICARCKKQASVVRDAFSEAFGVKNRLLRYGRDIRYRKPPPMVRGCIFIRRRAVPETPSSYIEWGSGVLQWEASSCWENV